MTIYTRTGDAGMTRLLGGMAVSKGALRVEAYGTIDELNSALGLAAALVADDEIRSWIGDLQTELFSLGAELASSEPADRVGKEQVKRLEETIDRAEGELVPQRGFIRPGGTAGAGALHLARTIARRAEREIIRLGETEEVSDWVVPYINRLSDLLHVLARLEAQRQTVRAIKCRIMKRLAGERKDVQDMGDLTLRESLRILDAAEAKAQEIGVSIVLAVTDLGGNLKAFRRMDGALLASVSIAVDKAYTAVALQMDTAQAGRLAQPGAPLYGIETTNSGRIVTFGGGLPLRVRGELAGGLGVSGGTVEQDIAVAEAGARVLSRD